MNLSRSTDNELYREIAAIASQFKIFECEPCAQAIQEFLIARNISGKVIQLYTGNEQGKYGNIYHDVLQRNIATNGRHKGVAVEFDRIEIIFDNIHHQGLPKKEWLENFYCIAIDLGSGFKITEIEF